MLKKARSAVVVGISAMALISCAPSLQQDSQYKIPTATTLKPTPEKPRAPGYVDCFGPANIKPKELSMDCVSDEVKLTDISWTQWQSDKAIGTGKLVGDSKKPREVEIVLTSPIDGVFTDLFVDGKLAQP